MTVKDLYELCKKEIEEGNGDRNIVLCVKGDEFHPLENKFSSPVYNDSAIYDLLEEWEEEEDNVIVLNQKGVETMSNLTHLFKVGQKVTYRNNDFDAVKRNIPCIVKETYPDHIIITDTETNTDLWIEEGFNMDCVFPEYNMIGG